MATRNPCSSTMCGWAVVLRTWFVALLAFPALGFGPTPPAAEAVVAAESGQETVVRAAPPVPNTDGKPVDELSSGESEEEEQASKRHGVHARGPANDHGVALAGVRVFGCTAPEQAVPYTPQLEHRLHNRGPPRA